MFVRDKTRSEGSPPSPPATRQGKRETFRRFGKNSGRQGLTLVEVLVILVIACVVIGMSIPAMQNMREMARRSNCQQNLMRLSLAMSSYASQFDHYPIGTINPTGPIRSEPQGYHHNWITGLLPMLEYQNAYDSIDRSVGVYAVENEPVRSLNLSALRCPTSGRLRDNTTCYAGISGSVESPIDENNDGVFMLNKIIGDNDIPDGLNYTAFLGEKVSPREDDLGWMSGTRSSLRVGAYPINADQIVAADSADPLTDPLHVGGLSSDHAGGAYMLMGSGENAFRSSSMDIDLLRQLASRSDQSE